MVLVEVQPVAFAPRDGYRVDIRVVAVEVLFAAQIFVGVHVVKLGKPQRACGAGVAAVKSLHYFLVPPAHFAQTLHVVVVRHRAEHGFREQQFPADVACIRGWCCHNMLCVLKM